MNALRFTLTAIALTALLAGCGGTQNALSVAPSSGTQNVAHVSHGTSWMLPEAKSEALMYVSDNVRNEVDVFAYPDRKKVGELSDFESPAGICIDKSQNVWISNQIPPQVMEYAHGGTSPISQLSVPGEWPTGCAFDPVSGNLGVVYSDNDVAIWANATGAPMTYTSSAVNDLVYCSYDGSGNFFAVGYSGQFPSTYFALAELPYGSDAVQQVTFNESLYPVEGIQWDGKYLAVGGYVDERHQPVKVYQIKVSGSQGLVEGTTYLKSRTDHTVYGQFWIQGNTIIESTEGERDIGMWRYPRGGNPVKVLKHTDTGTVGVAVSLASK